MIRLRLGALLALAVAFGAFSLPPEAMAAAEVHRLNVVISGMPSQIDGGGMNDYLGSFNQEWGVYYEPLDKITFGWLWDAEARYFVRPNFALCAGVGYLKATTKREYLPSINSSINLRGDVRTVPVHVGGMYYLAPYNRGDFQARAYVGGGVLSLTNTRARFSFSMAGMPSADQNGTTEWTAWGDSPGYYAEVGAHAFFAARYSVILGAIYHSMAVRELSGTVTWTGSQGTWTWTGPAGISDLDLSGLGLRMALGIGF